jgi:hypothetical protein
MHAARKLVTEADGAQQERTVGEPCITWPALGLCIATWSCCRATGLALEPVPQFSRTTLPLTFTCELDTAAMPLVAFTVADPPTFSRKSSSTFHEKALAKLTVPVPPTEVTRFWPTFVEKLLPTDRLLAPAIEVAEVWPTLVERFFPTSRTDEPPTLVANV